MRKICSKCEVEKNERGFCKDRKSKDGLFAWCKNCKNIYDKERSSTERVREMHRNSTRKYRIKHPTRDKEYRDSEHGKIIIKKYYKNNKDKILKKQKEDRKNNPDKYRKRGIEKYNRSREKIKKYNSLLEVKKNRNKREVKRRNNNPQIKIKHSISNIINKRLKKRLLSKDNKPTFSFLPYTLEQLMQHLESKFKPGMTWKNHGRYGWHIDHIKPDCLFNYKSIEDKEFQKCWALSNLQPLWAQENLRKSNKILKST